MITTLMHSGRGSHAKGGFAPYTQCELESCTCNYKVTINSEIVLLYRQV